MNHVYLDNNATTQIDPSVAAAILDCLQSGLVNPASQHQPGQRARQVLEQARDGIASILGARTADIHADRVILTSGGTEANRLALFGLIGPAPGRLVISSLEHPSIVGSAAELQRLGYEVVRLAATESGETQIDGLRQLLADGKTRLVSVMFANNETGALQNVQEISALCAEFTVPFHTDAVQAVGKIPVNFQSLNATAMTIAAHKFHGPVGVGALILKAGVGLEPTFFGGFQQAGLRPGTESVAMAVGMHQALRLWQENSQERIARVTALRDEFESTLAAQLPDLAFNGQAAPRLPNTSNVSFLGLDRQALLLALDMNGVACSTGSACASGSSEPSPILLAMGLSEPRIRGALRFSLSSQTTAADVAEGTRRIIQVCQHLRRRNSTQKTAAPARQ